MILIITQNLENIKQALSIMGMGMLGIFAFMAIFYGLILLMERVFRPKEER